MIDAADMRLRAVREGLIEIAAKAKLDSNLEKWQALGQKKDENVITSDFTFNIPEFRGLDF